MVGAIALDLDPGQWVYKRFWIVRSSGTGARVLVDSTTGQFIVLDLDAEGRAAA